MKHSCIVLPIACLALAGCGKGVPNRPLGMGFQQPLSYASDDRCTEVIATNGALLKFCQADSNVTIYESGADPSDITSSLTVANNPEVISKLQPRVPARKDLKSSREMISQSCVIKGKSYVNISLVDLKRILQSSGLHVVPDPEAARPGGRSATEMAAAIAWSQRNNAVGTKIPD